MGVDIASASQKDGKVSDKPLPPGVASFLQATGESDLAEVRRHIPNEPAKPDNNKTQQADGAAAAAGEGSTEGESDQGGRGDTTAGEAPASGAKPEGMSAPESGNSPAPEGAGEFESDRAALEVLREAGKRDPKVLIEYAKKALGIDGDVEFPGTDNATPTNPKPAAPVDSYVMAKDDPEFWETVKATISSGQDGDVQAMRLVYERAVQDNEALRSQAESTRNARARETRSRRDELEKVIAETPDWATVEPLMVKEYRRLASDPNIGQAAYRIPFRTILDAVRGRQTALKATNPAKAAASAALTDAKRKTAAAAAPATASAAPAIPSATPPAPKTAPGNQPSELAKRAMAYVLGRKATLIP